MGDENKKAIHVGRPAPANQNNIKTEVSESSVFKASARLWDCFSMQPQPQGDKKTL
jgi:hypothetical protein